MVVFEFLQASAQTALLVADCCVMGAPRTCAGPVLPVYLLAKAVLQAMGAATAMLMFVS